MSTKNGFTLVEMMIAVSILAVGITLVLRSLLSSTAALDSIEGRVAALSFLENSMDALEETALKGGEISAGNHEEETMLGNREAVFKSEVSEADAGASKDSLGIDEIKLSLCWQEGGRDKDAVLVAYLPHKK
jgi:type II secretion system protein I